VLAVLVWNNGRFAESGPTSSKARSIAVSRPPRGLTAQESTAWNEIANEAPQHLDAVDREAIRGALLKIEEQGENIRAALRQRRIAGPVSRREQPRADQATEDTGSY
jgi:hypothetical protein